MAIINGVGRVGVRVTSGGSTPAPQYPSSLKLFIDAGNPLSYPGTGNIVTDLVGTQNGTLVNGVGYSSSNGGYFTFDGVNDYIDFGINTAIQPTVARTVSMWVYIDLSSIGVFYSDYTTSTGRNGLLLNCDYNNGRAYFCGTSGNQYLVNTITKNTWTYFTFSFNGTTLKTYRNGVLINSSSQNFTMINGLNKTTIGDTHPSDGYPLKGRISQLKIYDTQLSDAEVLTDFNEFKTRYGFPSDSDAAAFVSAAGITDTTQMDAVNTLVTGLKSTGLWSKMKAIYPFVGGNSTAHSKNLKNPSQYNLTFSSGWNHTNTGALPNGTNGYIDTNLSPSQTTYTDFSYGDYIRTNSDGVYAEFGISNGNVYIYPRLGNTSYTRYASSENSSPSTDSRGFEVLTQKSGILNYYRNTTQLVNVSNSPSDLSVNTNNYFLSARNVSGTAAQFSNREKSFAFFSSGLLSSEVTTLYNLVQAFQTTLGRQV